MSITEHEHAAEVVTQREQRARTLEAAALEIEVNGWTQGCPQDDEGRRQSEVTFLLRWRAEEIRDGW